jgi:Flp pilus assembly protein TadG
MRLSKHRINRRRGAMLIFAAVLLPVFVAIVAFVIDLGRVTLVRAQLQRAADSAALAGAGYTVDGVKPLHSDEVNSGVVSAFFGEKGTTEGRQLAVLSKDIRVGRLSSTTSPVSVVPLQPGQQANAVEVVIRRDATANGKLALFFARIFGAESTTLVTKSIGFAEDGIRGFRMPNPGCGPCKLLPYTMKKTDWDAAMASGTDEFSVDEDSRSVVAGTGDGKREVKLFPGSAGSGSHVTPGNFGTIDIGSPNNSTADLARQILNGPNAADFAQMPSNMIQLGSDGTLLLNGDTGISAGVKDELASIIGQPRIIPLYDEVTGNGNNAKFRIVKWVGCTIVDVKLTGSLSSKFVKIQPCVVVDCNAVGGGTPDDTSSFVRTPLQLIE